MNILRNVGAVLLIITAIASIVATVVWHIATSIGQTKAMETLVVTGIAVVALILYFRWKLKRELASINELLEARLALLEKPQERGQVAEAQSQPTTIVVEEPFEYEPPPRLVVSIARPNIRDMHRLVTISPNDVEYPPITRSLNGLVQVCLKPDLRSHWFLN
jgi:hypothetical protein